MSYHERRLSAIAVAVIAVSLSPCCNAQPPSYIQQVPIQPLLPQPYGQQPQQPTWPLAPPQPLVGPYGSQGPVPADTYQGGAPSVWPGNYGGDGQVNIPGQVPQQPGVFGSCSRGCSGGSCNTNIPSFNYGGGAQAGGFNSGAVSRVGSAVVYSASAYGPILPNVDFGCCFIRYSDTMLAGVSNVANTSGVVFEVCLHLCLASGPTFSQPCVAVQYVPKTRECFLFAQTGRGPPAYFVMKYGFDYYEATNRPGCQQSDRVVDYFATTTTSTTRLTTTVTTTTPYTTTTFSTRSSTFTTTTVVTRSPSTPSFPPSSSATPSTSRVTSSSSGTTQSGSDDVTKKCPNAERIPNKLPPLPADPTAFQGITSANEGECVQSCLDAKSKLGFTCKSIAWFPKLSEGQNCLLSGASKTTDPNGLNDSGGTESEYVGLDNCGGAGRRAAVLSNDVEETETYDIRGIQPETRSQQKQALRKKLALSKPKQKRPLDEDVVVPLDYTIGDSTTFSETLPDGTSQEEQSNVPVSTETVPESDITNEDNVETTETRQQYSLQQAPARSLRLSKKRLHKRRRQ